MESQSHISLYIQLEKSDCWLDSLSFWEFPLAKVSLCSLVILLLQKSFLVVEWSGKLLNQILPKMSILAKIYFTTVLNTLCKPFPMLRVAFNAPFHSNCICLIRSRILERAYLLLTFLWVWLLSRMCYNISVDMRSLSDSSAELMASMSCSLIIIDSFSDSSPISAQNWRPCLQVQ